MSIARLEVTGWPLLAAAGVQTRLVRKFEGSYYMVIANERSYRLKRVEKHKKYMS